MSNEQSPLQQGGDDVSNELPEVRRAESHRAEASLLPAQRPLAVVGMTHCTTHPRLDFCLDIVPR
jgi:hypothetical protein